MDIHIDAEVFCGGESCGEVTYVIIEPINDEVTHFVVKENSFPHIERLVSIKHIVKADLEKVVLDCTPEEFSKMENFVEYEFIRGISPIYGYGSGELWMPSLSMMELEHIQVPAGELAIHYGAKVFAKDGHIGKIDDFLIKSKNNGHITHIVLKEGHLWAAKNVTIPVSEIRKIDDEGIHLKLKKKEIEALPSVKASGWFN
jgi:uncharacterized protein YrrD